MRKTFYEYYSLKKSDLDTLWKEALIVFDTNVLLSLYRRPLEVREDIINVLKSIKSRIWIPHQVGLEFHDHRLDEANRPINAINALVDKFQKFSNDIQRDYENNPYLDYKKIKASLSRICSNVQKNVNSWLGACPNYLNEDMILNELTELFDNRVGESFPESKLQDIFKEGETRYSNNVPPGYKDRNKHQGEQHRYGDLIIWYQIIEKAKSEQKDILFVTDDQKEDWWEVYNGYKTGPCRELIREFCTKTDNQRVWFYTTERFLQEIKSHEGIPVNAKTIEEVRRPVFDFSSFWRTDAQSGELSVGSIFARPLASLADSSNPGKVSVGNINIIAKPLTAESKVMELREVKKDDNHGSISESISANSPLSDNSFDRDGLYAASLHEEIKDDKNNANQTE